MGGVDEMSGKPMIEDVRLRGHKCCAGCAGAIAERLIFNVVGKRAILFGTGVCAGMSSSMANLPKLTLHFSGGGGAGAAGIAAGLEVTERDDIPVIAMGGDGAVSDISIGQVSACAQRNDNILFFCMDNEAYMNTGIQKSTLTPYGSVTTTTPKGSIEWKKDLPLLVAFHHVPYVATVSPAYTQDLTQKVKKALGIRGYRYIHVLAPCPTGWGYDPAKSIKVAKAAVTSGLFPLYEIEWGKLKFTVDNKQRTPVKEYMDLQKRFRLVKESELDLIEGHIRDHLNQLEGLSRITI
jgi:pyruvate ferredoxin oxidoreductase beta subunit